VRVDRPVGVTELADLSTVPDEGATGIAELVAGWLAVRADEAGASDDSELVTLLDTPSVAAFVHPLTRTVAAVSTKTVQTLILVAMHTD